MYSIRLCGLIYNFYLGCLSHCFGKEVHFPYYYQLKVEVQICHSHALDTEVASVPYYSCRGLGVLAPLLVYTDTSQLRRVREICYFFPHAILSVERSSVKIWTDCVGVSLISGRSLPWGKGGLRIAAHWRKFFHFAVSCESSVAGRVKGPSLLFPWHMEIQEDVLLSILHWLKFHFPTWASLTISCGYLLPGYSPESVEAAYMSFAGICGMGSQIFLMVLS